MQYQTSRTPSKQPLKKSPVWEFPHMCGKTSLKIHYLLQISFCLLKNTVPKGVPILRTLCLIDMGPCSTLRVFIPFPLSFFSTKGALRRPLTNDNHPSIPHIPLKTTFHNLRQTKIFFNAQRCT